MARRRGGFFRRARAAGRRARRAFGRARRAYNAYRMGAVGKLGLATVFFGPLLQVFGGWKGVSSLKQWHTDSGKDLGKTAKEFFDRLCIVWVGFKPSDGSTWSSDQGGWAAWRYVGAGGAMVGGDMAIAYFAKKATRRLTLPVIGQLVGSK